MSRFRLACIAAFLLIFAPQALSAQPQTAQTNNGIVFGIWQYDPQFGQILRIGIADLTQHTSNLMAYHIGFYSYKPSPDERYLAYGNYLAEDHIQCEIRDLQNGAELIYRGEVTKQCIPLWSANSQRVVLATQSGARWSAKIFDPNTQLLTDTDLSFASILWGDWEASRSPDGQTMLFSVPADKNLYKLLQMNIQTGEVTPLDIAPACSWDFFWSSSGDRVQLTAKYPLPNTATGWFFNVYMYDIRQQQNYLLYDHKPVLHLRWSPDGKRFAFVEDYSQIKIVDEQNHIQSVSLPEGETRLSELVWVAENDTLVVNTYGAEGSKLWRLQAETLTWSQIYIPKHKGLSWWFSPNRNLLSLSYYSGENWHYGVFDLRTNHLIPVNLSIPNHSEGYWSANSQQLCWQIRVEERNQANQITRQFIHQYVYDVLQRRLTSTEIQTFYGPRQPCGSILSDEEALTQMIKSTTIQGLPLAESTEFFAPLRVH